MIGLWLCILAQLQVGEGLEYEVRYGPLKAGRLELEVEGVTPVAGEDCYHFSGRLRSNPDLRLLFSVDDRLEAWARKGDLVTLRALKEVSETGYQNRVVVDFDYQAGLIRYSDGLELPLVEGCRDFLTILYYLRTLPLELGKEFPILNHEGRRTYQARAVVVDTGWVKTPCGEFPCFRVDSRVDPGEVSGRFGRFSVWVSRDENRLPVLIRSSFVLGHLTAVITRVE